MQVLGKWFGGDVNKLLAEMVGTFALVFAGTGAIVADHLSGGAVTHPGIALTFGLVVMAVIYAVGDISGAHLNPAVTLGFFMAGRFGAGRIPGYLAAQFAGAMLASGLLWALLPSSPTLGATVPAAELGISAPAAFVLEVILTALLMFVILCVATGSKEQGMMAGIAVGGVIALQAMFAGPFTGASMNPARSLAPALFSGEWASQWIYLVAPPLGAALAVPVWLGCRERQCDDAEAGKGGAS